MIWIVAATIWFLAVLWWAVNDHYERWKDYEPIDHFKEWIKRAVLLLPSIFLLALPQIKLMELVLTGSLVAFMFLLLFDGFYNNKRKFSWWFTGSVDPDDSQWDKWQREIPLPLRKILKIGIPLGLLITYVLTR